MPPDKSPDFDAVTAEHWAEMAQKQVSDPEQRAATGWLDSPLVHELYIHPRISGMPDVGWFEWVTKNYVPMDAKASCVLGCGSGGLERHARALGFRAAFDSYDISEGALEVARGEADRLGLEGINYEWADLNNMRLPPERYEVVFASMSLHHIDNLEALVKTAHEALVPGGRLIFNEFVGPRKFQWTDLQLEIVNRALAGLPSRLRQDLVLVGETKTEVKRPTIQEMNAIDPSEAARSDEIMPLVERYFRPLVVREYGGTLVHLLLDRIVGNFRRDRQEDVDRLEALFRLESACLESAVLPSDFCVAVFERD